MDKLGKVYNERLNADIFKIDKAIVDSAKKNRYSNSKDIRVNREYEKQRVSSQNNIEKRLTNEETEVIQIKGELTSQLQGEEQGKNKIVQKDVKNQDEINKNIDKANEKNDISNIDGEITIDEIAQAAQEFFDKY